MAAAAVVSVSMGVMKPVLTKLATLMGDEYKKLRGLRKMVAFLQRELRDMDAFLEIMDSADELDPLAKNWRKDIIEMSYNIEDCIDDFMQRVGEADDKMGILRKASQYLRTFKDRRRLANQFQEIKTQVMEASERRKRYMLDQSISITAPVVVDPRLSAIYKESASLVGIDGQRNELVNWAMHKGKKMKLMAIVGLGGLGKTTLANEVYRKVGGKFDCKAFVSVSQKPEIIGLFNTLLLQLGLETYSHGCQLQDPIDNLRGHLQHKRYLIVVDDLWDIRAWNAIRCAFPQNNQQSRVMITTRDQNLARLCCGKHEGVYNMRPLSEKDSKKLFFDRIFGSEDACPSEFRNASHEIFKKCDGLPLAIITMASLLACQPRLEGQWEYIQNSLAAGCAPNSNYEDMMYILDLSYKNLPRHLKACFLYLGSYPEDEKINIVDLLRRWVAEGFVSNSSRQDVWVVVESYFNELVNRNMIQLIYKDEDGDEEIIEATDCRVHDMFLELIIRRCKEDNFLSLVYDPQEAVEEARDKVIRRLTIVGLKGAGDDKADITTTGHLSKIRSLTILTRLVPPLLEFKFLRVLVIDSFHNMAMDLSGINQLLQLRYLKIAVERVRNLVLPGQIRGLQYLETLDVSALWGSQISLEIIDVPRLSHLVVPSETTLPEWIGKVKSLRTLHEYSLPMDSVESIIGLGELTGLSDLFLFVPIRNYVWPLEATWMRALSSSLNKLSNLKVLRLRPHIGVSKCVALCADALSSLTPPFCNLEELYLGDVLTFSQVPRWIGHLHNLHKLHFGVKQILAEDIDIIGTSLPSLVRLYLRISGVLTERIMIGGSMGFPALEMFWFDCDVMSFLTFETGAMPELRKLELSFVAVQWDKSVPAGLQHLQSLEEISVVTAKYQSDLLSPSNAEKKLIRSMFNEVADDLPTLPEVTFSFDKYRYTHRPMEEEDYLDNCSSEED